MGFRAKHGLMILSDLRPHLVIEWPFVQKRIWRLRERKARVLSEDQDIGVELALWCKILQESSRRKLGQEISRDSK